MFDLFTYLHVYSPNNQHFSWEQKEKSVKNFRTQVKISKKNSVYICKYFLTRYF